MTSTVAPPAAFGLGALGLQEQAFGAVEAEIDRVERVDRREQAAALSFARGDEVARIDAAVGYAAADRRAHLGEFDVERARANPGIGRRERRRSGADARVQLVEIALRHRLVGDQPVGAGEVDAREFEVAARARGIGACFGERGIEGPRVEGEEQLALADDLAVGEVDADKFARDARAHLDRTARLEAADIIVPFGNVAHQRRGDGDDRDWRRGDRFVGAAGERVTAGDEERERQADQRAAVPAAGLSGGAGTGDVADFARLGPVEGGEHVHYRYFRKRRALSTSATRRPSMS